MLQIIAPEEIQITKYSENILSQILHENTDLKELIEKHNDYNEFIQSLEKLFLYRVEKDFTSYEFYKKNNIEEYFTNLHWEDYAAIRLLDYLYHEGREFEDLNLHGKKIKSEPFKLLWLASKNKSGGASEYFFEDMLYLFRQFNGKFKNSKPDKMQVLSWMDKHPSGLDDYLVELRKRNKNRILKLIINKIDSGEIHNARYSFDKEKSIEEKLAKAYQWWDEIWFHLKFAVRSPELLNEFLDNSLDKKTMDIMHKASEKGIPIFVNPYYLSLLNVDDPNLKNADYAIRDYILYSEELIEEFGNIVAWEKEDITEQGKPNAAGWILPDSNSVHRRYPEVSILIPDTIGRACGGLCASCQRMYDFQRGNLNFNLDKLAPKESWNDKLKRLMDYYEKDSQIRDILITGGDALMSNDSSLKKIFDSVYEMANNKIQANKSREDGEKFAELLRVRLGTRLPVYLPQRINEDLGNILSDFKERASQIGIKQFVIQTHFESAMEVTPESAKAINILMDAGWIVTNQLVLTAAASRRGHTAKLRKVLNDIGVITYYTFSVKGYLENKHNFATNERAIQEQMEEKFIGKIPQSRFNEVKRFANNASRLIMNINKIRKEEDIPFLATDRSVLNLPGVGKSLTFRVIGITRDGRRILEFDHDTTRAHSPVIEKMGKVVIIESKAIREYLNQLQVMGENPDEYETIWGYSFGTTEKRIPIFEYPEYEFETTEELTNFEIVDACLI